MNVNLVLIFAIRMELVKTKKVVIRVSVILDIVTHCLMVNRAQVKFFPQFVCFFRPQVSTFKNEIENIKIRHKKKTLLLKKKIF